MARTKQTPATPEEKFWLECAPTREDICEAIKLVRENYSLTTNDMASFMGIETSRQEALEDKDGTFAPGLPYLQDLSKLGLKVTIKFEQE